MSARIDVDAIEARVRKMAHSLPPSDFGSTRAIQAVTSFVVAEIAALTLTREILRGQLMAHGIEPLVTKSEAKP